MTAAPILQPGPFPDSGVNHRLTPECTCKCQSHRPKPKRPKRYKENPEYMKDLRALIRRCVIRVGGRGDLEGLADLREVVDEAERALADSVTALKDTYDFPWSEIGRVLGITRQAAQQKYGRTR